MQNAVLDVVANVVVEPKYCQNGGYPEHLRAQARSCRVVVACSGTGTTGETVPVLRIDLHVGARWPLVGVLAELLTNWQIKK